MEIHSHHPQETKELAYKLANKIKPSDILALYGDLGSGKTTFVRYITEALGFKDRVQSPTFVIMRSYSEGGKIIKKINHIDLYRITTPEEIKELGLEEIFQEEGAITLIEWPELIEDALPPAAIFVHFEDLGEKERKISIKNLI